MNDLPWILALAAGGLAGGMLIARRRNAVVWLLWLALPFAGLFAILAIEASQEARATHVADKLALGFVLYALLMAPPWLGANLVGWMLGKRLLPSKPAGTSPDGRRPAATAQPARPAEDNGLPDWDRIDNPRVELWDLGKRLKEYAIRGGLDPAALPLFDTPPGGTGECIIHDKFGYLYMGFAEGRILFEETSSNAERMCYQVLRRHAEEMARRRLAAEGLDPDDDPAAVRREIGAILAAIDPRWGRFFSRMPPRRD